MSRTKRTRNQSQNLAESNAASAPTVEELDNGHRRVVEKYGQAKTMQKAYNAYVTNGKKFLQKIVATAAKSKEGVGLLWCNEPVPIGTLMRDPNFAIAFENIPNEHTPCALVLFILKKCVHEGWWVKSVKRVEEGGSSGKGLSREKETQGEEGEYMREKRERT